MYKLTNDELKFLLTAVFITIVLNIIHPAIVIYGLSAGLTYAFIAIAVGIIVACIPPPKQKKPNTFD
jgi:hypothetical protein